MHTFPEPEIDVRGNGSVITAGDTSPSVSDSTDFGSAVSGGAAVARTFTVANEGSSLLTLSNGVQVSGVDASDFSVSVLPSGTVAAGDETTFVVSFAPLAVGSKAATLTIASDDGDEGSFAFSVGGVGVPAPGRYLTPT